MSFEKEKFLAKYGNGERANELADHPHWSVRGSLYKNPHLSHENQQKLRNDLDWYVRRRMLSHSDTTLDDVIKAMDDEDIDVRNDAHILHRKLIGLSR